MVTSKSTVLGLRLDHERRAWVEAEAGRRGISVRALFEEFIDGAQGVETAAEANEPAGSEDRTGRAVGEPATERLTSAAASDVESTDAGCGPRTISGADTSRRSDIGSVAAVPGRLIRGAFLLPVNVIKSSGRCAQKRLESCPVVKSWSGR